MSTDGLDLSLLLISIIAPVGAFDVLYFHIYKFRLARRPASFAETRTHIVRSLTLGLVTAILTLFQPSGLWFWAVAGLFVVDVVNSGTDAVLERDSRADLGGLPRLEYLIHIVGATFMGAVAISFLVRGWPLASLDTALAPRPTPLPTLMQLNGLAIAAGSIILAGYEAVVMMASARRRPVTGCCS